MYVGKWEFRGGEGVMTMTQLKDRSVIRSEIYGHKKEGNEDKDEELTESVVEYN